MTLIYKIEEQLPLDVQPDVDEALLPVTETIGSLTPSVSLDQRDDPFLTTTGTYFLVRDKVSRRFLGGSNDFDRLEGDSRYFRSLGSAIVAAGALRFGYAQAHGGTTLPVGERFYVGGASTHRGFREQELGPKGTTGRASAARRTSSRTSSCGLRSSGPSKGGSSSTRGTPGSAGSTSRISAGPRGPASGSGRRSARSAWTWDTSSTSARARAGPSSTSPSATRSDPPAARSGHGRASLRGLRGGYFGERPRRSSR
ncbi:MAG: BamA/TamA family outer membrane protein [Holophagales bacterium]|nr:BamA/TamA family outer membrane protein [Holophagales bacterium]